MKLSPNNINEHNWCYDDEDGLWMVHEVYKDGRYVQTDQFTLPWSIVRAALARKDKRKAPRRSAA